MQRRLWQCAARAVGGADDWIGPCGPSGGVGVANWGNCTTRAKGIVWASSRQVGDNIHVSVAVGVVGAAGRVNTSLEEELARGQAEKGSENSLESVNIVFGLNLCCVLNDAQPHSGLYK